METLFDGIMLGATIALVTVGYALIYSVLRFINFAHGEVMTLGAYLTYTFYNVMGISSLTICVVLAVVSCTLFGLIVERAVYRPMRGQPAVSLLLSSLGVSIVLQGVYAIVFSSSPVPTHVPDPVFLLGDYGIYVRNLITLGLAVILFGATEWVVRCNVLGIKLRAMASNPRVAPFWGLSVDWIVGITFAVASGLAAIAGIVLSVEEGITPGMGFQFSVWAFTAVVVGGLGSIRGAMIGSLVLGLVLSFSMRWVSSSMANAVALSVMGLVLLFRPQGLLPERLRRF